MFSDIIVVGGGASGMMAAIQCARQNKQVVILEHKDRVGKKILATGNGKCNYTNLSQTENCYRSNESSFPMKVINQFDVHDTIAFFEELGIVPKEKNGYLYPNSEQAASILDVLRMELDYLGVKIYCDEHVKIIKKGKHTFTLETNHNIYQSKKIILCTGGRASANLGSDGSGYELAKQMGHTICKTAPALVALKSVGSFFKGVAGVRTQARITLLIDKNVILSEAGELQLTNYGVSGIPVFQISRYATLALDKKNKVEMEIDFLPEMNETDCFSMLLKRKNQNGYKYMEDFMVGMLNKKLITMILKEAKIDLNMVADQLSKQQLKSIINKIKHFHITITDCNPFEQAQVCAGGVDTTKIHSETMESKIVKGLYFAGEIVDVDGTCGGYNLQWAWSSGYVAGNAAVLN